MKKTVHPLSPPPLDELARVLTSALEENYAYASATVVDCPDLSLSPFYLAGSGLCGCECVADIGGQPHLFPRPKLDKKYSLIECARDMKMNPEYGMLIGAGAGPFHVIGGNSELASNLSWSGGFNNVQNLTRFAKINGTAEIMVRKSPSTDCALMMNLFGSSGHSGHVLKIMAKSRRGSEKSFTECIRRALNNTYGSSTQISMGGVFLIRKGKALFHIMPDFPNEDRLPFKDRHDLNRWLTYHGFSAPIVCLTVFHSADPESLGLRMEHTHCFSTEKNEGGHYHHDLPPDEADLEEIEYEAYLNTAKTLYRIDQPETFLGQHHRD
ncbi:hypothetical protein M433DRAFT_7096 [Acidomyces richmondensis BFW]|nr:MAG: hypothetical protein FE78DRAFT_141850 [Acidomyces sp. 'richmondensis']KYG42505.1 hypothetical protein M433DRAFT_7096 [Acidomyces richmondensis BFW]